MQVSSLRQRLPLIAAGTALTGLFLYNRHRANRALEDNPPLGQFLRVDGVDLHYMERGEGPPLLLIHGNGTMVQDWLVSGLFDELAKTNRVIAIDRPGFGHSRRPRGTFWTPERQAELFAGAAWQLGVEQATVIGHSYGTQLAVALALAHPELVTRLVLIGGYYFPTPRADVWLIAPSALPVYGEIVRHTLMPLAGKALVPRINARIFGPAPVPEAWRRRFPMEMALRPSRVRAGAADAAQMVPAAARLAKRYGELELPVTLVAGRGDRMVDTATQSEQLHEQLPHSKLVLLDGIGHMVHHSDMPSVAAAVRKA